MNTDYIHNEIAEVKQNLLHHPIYQAIHSIEDLQRFTQHHVYAVWDFMSLLKALQQKLTCVTTPWRPVGHPQTRYLINEIVLAEETDEDMHGNRSSHYEMYLEAMKALGVDTRKIERQIITLTGAPDLLDAIEQSSFSSGVKKFLTFTFQLVLEGAPHEIAAAFTYGREDLIPDLFTALISGMNIDSNQVSVKELHYYFDRHIELDGDEHGPMAHEMVALLCGEDQSKWEEAAQVAHASLQHRIELFDGIVEFIKQPENEPVY